MGEKFYINRDGSVTHTMVKTINNIEWVDFAQYKGKYSAWQIILHLLFLFPIFGWGAWVITWCGVRLLRGYWPFFGIRAIESTDNPIKVYCDKKGKLGLYANKHRITSSIYNSVKLLPTIDYPAFIMESNGKFSIYNYTQRKLLFKDSDNIKYLGDNTVLIQKGDKQEKYSLIGMRLG